jgi:hypothetical protein
MALSKKFKKMSPVCALENRLIIDCAFIWWHN